TVTFQWTRVAHQGNWLHELKAGYIPRNFYNTRRNVGGPPLTTDGQLRDSLAPTVNISNVASFGGGYILLTMYTRPVQGMYSTTLFKANHSIKFGGDVMWTYFDYLRYQGPQSGSYTFSSIANFLAGLYFDRLWENPITPTYYNNQFVGPQINATWTFGQPGAPTYPNTIPGTTLPSNATVGVRNVFIVPSSVKLPETVQGIVTLEHAVSSSL